VAPSAGTLATTVGGLSTAAPKLWPVLQAPNVAAAEPCHVKSA
jgi:hypothetical protein